jgi:type IV secretory pathway VirJ component
MLFLVLPARSAESVDTFAPFGTVHLYYQPEKISTVTLFISGDGGWNLGVVNMARILSSMNTLVVGIDIRGYIRYLNACGGKCCYPPGDFENLSKYLQQKLRLPEYHTPVIVGYSSGATLAYTLLAQAPHGTFTGAISMGFCPDLPVVKPFCRQNGLEWKMSANGKNMLFEPCASLATPWIAFQGQVDQVCSPVEVDSFVAKCGSSRTVRLDRVGHGFSVEKNWVPQFRASFDSIIAIQKKTAPAPPHDAAVSDLPIIELPADTGSSDRFAVILSGDGGWAGIDKGIAGALASEGIPVAGFNSLQYFWKVRTPEEMSRDLDRIISHYAVAWKRKRCIVIGYSFGADVLPFMAAKLPAATLERISMFAFLGLSSRTDFQFHLTDWLGTGAAPSSKPVLPEIEKLKGRPMLYIYGTDEKDNLSSSIDRKAVKVIPIEGGHHFGGNYRMLADSILASVQQK